MLPSPEAGDWIMLPQGKWVMIEQLTGYVSYGTWYEVDGGQLIGDDHIRELCRFD
jgi:hypothetical protein